MLHNRDSCKVKYLEVVYQDAVEWCWVVDFTKIFCSPDVCLTRSRQVCKTAQACVWRHVSIWSIYLFICLFSELADSMSGLKSTAAVRYDVDRQWTWYYNFLFAPLITWCLDIELGMVDIIAITNPPTYFYVSCVSQFFQYSILWTLRDCIPNAMKLPGC